MTKIRLLELVITDPISAISDIIIGIISLYVASKLFVHKDTNKDTRHFVNYFFLMGLSTIFAGVLGHALQHYLSTDWKVLGWSLSATALFFFQLASISYFKERLGKMVFGSFVSIIIIQIVTFHLAIFWPETRSFKVVQLNLTIGYIGVIIPLYLFAFFAWKEENVKRIFLAIAIASFASVCYNLKISLHQWFDHNVVAHFVVAAFLLVLYSAVIKLLNLNTDSAMAKAPK